ncbi:MAG: amino acid ABC transporter ATP-binding protein [Firmicutes bacterium]|jgi:polar amino acid transport system ATP-binding protein|nr:amino acid ABC transporter ATP-binding protein [Bacillota bacterium]
MKEERDRPLVEIRGLTKSYRKKPVLSGVDLTIYPGETVVLMGPSGCGKSTLVRCINRLTEPDGGEIYFENRLVTALSAHQLAAIRRKMGYVFQQFNLIQRLNVIDNVTMALRVNGVPPAEARERGMEALALVGMDGKATEYPGELSGGEQQRVGIARALAQKPRLMLWDEPTASLDPILVGEVLEVMEKVIRTEETTMLIVTHEVDFSRRAADRILFLAGGKIIEEGPAAEVLENPQSEIGKKYKNLLKK